MTKTTTHQSVRKLIAILLSPYLINNQKTTPVQAYYRPLGFQEVEAHRFQDNRHMNVVRLSTLHTGRLYPTGNIPGTHFY